MEKRIIVALDFIDRMNALNFIVQNGLEGLPVKVGMQLFYREGPKIIEKLKENGHFIFLDLKLHDIPNTVKEAMKQLASLEIDLVNVHAAGGSKMIEAAREGIEIGSRNKRPKLLAVTQLTSTDEKTLKNELLIQESLDDVVVQYASNSVSHGADGVVCSAHEVQRIKREIGEEIVTVTPGIRLAGDSVDDQVRPVTPSLAKQLGVDHIVVGRSITKASDPKNAYKRALKEWTN